MAYSRDGRTQGRQWPRLAVERQDEISRDHNVFVREAHEKERTIFRDALADRDFTKAYQIYEEYRGLPVLTGAEVTSLVQLISADATLRKWHGYEQPESLYEVLCTIIEDVKAGQVSGQAMLWTHALDAMVTANRLEAAEELWLSLQTLPNRQLEDKHEAMCIDSRVYGKAIKLYTALNDMPKVEALYREALFERSMMPSLMLDQALIQALFQNKRIGDAYKHMDKTLREQRRLIGPGFFNNMISLALDAEAIGVASEIFMKACKTQVAPSSPTITRLLAAVGKSSKDPLSSVNTIFRHYRALSRADVPIEHLNCVLEAIFRSAEDEVPYQEILSRVHQLLKEMQERDLQSSTSTTNILLKGYISIGAHDLAQDLFANSSRDQNTFRTLLKAYAETKDPAVFPRVKECWTRCKQYLEKRGRLPMARDLKMLMRAAFATDREAAREWASQEITTFSDKLDSADAKDLLRELARHLDGSFRPFDRTRQDSRQDSSADPRLMKIPETLKTRDIQR